MDEFEKIAAETLRIKNPWYIKTYKIDEAAREVVIHVGIIKDGDFPCPKCGGKTVRNGYEPYERMFIQPEITKTYGTIVYCKRPRVKCKNCGTLQVVAPFERLY